MYVDDRVGSVELAPLLPGALVVRLEYGDVMLDGWGAEGRVKVGVERKRVGDLVNSVLTGRLAGHQLPGMREEYDRVYVVVEGEWRKGHADAIEVLKEGKWRRMRTGRLGWTALKGWVMTMEEMWQVRVRYTPDIEGTAEEVRRLARWWGKPWEGHKGHKVVWTGGEGRRVVSLGPVSTVRKVASVLKGVGYERSKAVAERFSSVEAMCRASEEEWTSVEGIGKVTARLVRGQLHGQ
jgi:ERCC4-type nuclease